MERKIGQDDFCTPCPRPLIRQEGNIQNCKCCPIRDDTVNRIDYRPKIILEPCYPEWIENCEYYKPDTNMERCTTYSHFYVPHQPKIPCTKPEVGTPGAIPFSTCNDLVYRCVDPKPCQKTPVVMREDIPWPYIKTKPLIYSNNLELDSCSPFAHETIYKNDYYAKTLCGRVENLKPLEGYVPTLVPFNDDTTMKISYPSYTYSEYKTAFGNAGNPNGIQWGPFKCPTETDKCLPRFPAPYGNPLKPFFGRRCPCGPFDNRSSYYRDFIFRNREVINQEQERKCRQVVVPLGDSLYRSSFISPGGKKAEVMEPPSSKGYRTMHPSSLRDTDTLYRLSYFDFWKNLSREELELYRGQSTNPNRKIENKCKEEEDVETEVVLVPVYPNKSKGCTNQTVSTEKSEEIEFPNLYKNNPYSGANILNRAKLLPRSC